MVNDTCGFGRMVLLATASLRVATLFIMCARLVVFGNVLHRAWKTGESGLRVHLVTSVATCKIAHSVRWWSSLVLMFVNQYYKQKYVHTVLSFAWWILEILMAIEHYSSFSLIYFYCIDPLCSSLWACNSGFLNKDILVWEMLWNWPPIILKQCLFERRIT